MAAEKTVFSEVPQILTIIKTGFRWTYKVECGLSTSHFYVSGSNSVIKHLSTNGELLEEIVTKSKNVPRCFTVNKKGQLIYSDSVDRSINIVKGREIERLVRLGGWKPNSICSTTADEILVALKADDGDEAKVVRYANSKMTQEIQYNSDGQPLYLDPHYIDENKNSDIVVSDFDKKEIIVVDKVGKYKFSYHGNHLTKTHEEFSPRGITTDSMCQILIADFDNNLIHIIDHDGKFLRYIENCNLHLPLDLSTNSDDVLFVVEYYSNKVKEVKYLK